MNAGAMAMITTITNEIESSTMISPPVLTHIAVEQSQAICDDRGKDEIRYVDKLERNENKKSLPSEYEEECKTDAPILMREKLRHVDDVADFKKCGTDLLMSNGPSEISPDDNGRKDSTEKDSEGTHAGGETKRQPNIGHKSPNHDSDKELRSSKTNERANGEGTVEDVIKSNDIVSQNDSVSTGKVCDSETLISDALIRSNAGVANNDNEKISTKIGEIEAVSEKLDSLASSEMSCKTPKASEPTESDLAESGIDVKTSDDSMSRTVSVEKKEDVHLTEIARKSLTPIVQSELSIKELDVSRSESAEKVHNVENSIIDCKQNLLNPQSACKKRRKSGSCEQKSNRVKGDELDFQPFQYEKVESSLGNGLKVKYRRKSAEVLTDSENKKLSEDCVFKKEGSSISDGSLVAKKGAVLSGSCNNLAQLSKDTDAPLKLFVSTETKRSLSKGDMDSESDKLNKKFTGKQCDKASPSSDTATKDKVETMRESRTEDTDKPDCEHLSRNTPPRVTDIQTSVSPASNVFVPSPQPNKPHVTSSAPTILSPSPSITSSLMSHSSSQLVVSTSTSVKTPLLSSKTSPSPSHSPVSNRVPPNASNKSKASDPTDQSKSKSVSASPSFCDKHKIDNQLKSTPKVLIRKLPDEIFQRYYYLKHEMNPEEMPIFSPKRQNRNLEISPGLVFKFKKYSPRSELYQIRSKSRKASCENSGPKTYKYNTSKRSNNTLKQTKKQTRGKGVKYINNDENDSTNKDNDPDISTKSVHIRDSSDISSLVDPKIISMSSALLQAFKKETPAENIAFKKRPSFKSTKATKSFKPCKPVSKMHKVFKQTHTQKRGSVLEKKTEGTKVSLTKSQKERTPSDPETGTAKTPKRKTPAVVSKHNSSNKRSAVDRNTLVHNEPTEVTTHKRARKPKCKRETSCQDSKTSQSSEKRSALQDRNIFKNDIFSEIKESALTPDEDKGIAFDEKTKNGRKQERLISDITKDTDLMLEDYYHSSEDDKRDKAQQDTVSKSSTISKLNDEEELAIGQSIIEHAKHWDLQASKLLSSGDNDAHPEMPDLEIVNNSTDLPKLSPVDTKLEYHSELQNSSLLPILIPERSKQSKADSVPNVTKRIKTEQTDSSSSGLDCNHSSNFTSLSIDCAHPLDLTATNSKTVEGNEYSLVPSNVPLSMNIPEIKITSPGSSITTFGQLTPISNPPSCASLSPFLSPSQPPSGHRFKCLSSPSRNGGKRGGILYSGKPSPLYQYSPNQQRAPRRDYYPEDSHESDDSDATVVYPKKNKKYPSGISHKETSFCTQKGLDNTGDCNLTTDDMNESSNFVKQEDDFPNFGDKLEKCKHELATLVSDIRENVAKHKAMKRNRRTNSFSGENNLPIAQKHEQVDNFITSRPSLERFISVEPLMDSDTPYKSMSRDAGDDNFSLDETRKDHNLLDFVTMLNLQTGVDNSLEDRESNESDSEAETKLYDMNFSHLKQTKDVNKVRIRFPKSKNAIENKSCEGCDEMLSPGSRLEIDMDSNNDDTHPDIVIENAETDHIILGQEAMEKMRSGIFQQSERNSQSFAKKRRKRSRLSFTLEQFPQDNNPKAESDSISEKSGKSLKRVKSKRSKHEMAGTDGAQVLSQCNGSDSSGDDTAGQLQKTILSPGSTASGNTIGEFGNKSIQSSEDRGGSLSPDLASGSKQTKPKRGRKPKASIDPLAEQITQSSTARILQELPRFNWLEQKILQQSSNSYKQAATATSNSGSNNNNSNNNDSTTNSSNNNNSNNNTSNSYSPSSQRPSKSSPHAANNNAQVSPPNTTSSRKSPSSAISSPSSSSSSSSTTQLNFKRKDNFSSSSSSSSSKVGEKNFRAGKYNVADKTSPTHQNQEKTKSDSSKVTDGPYKMASVATPTTPSLKLSDDLIRKSPAAMTSEERQPPSIACVDVISIKKSANDNNTKDGSISNSSRGASPNNNNNNNNDTSNSINDNSSKTTSSDNQNSSSVKNDHQHLQDDTELDLNIPSPENLTIDFGPLSSEHEEDKTADESKVLAISENGSDKKEVAEQEAVIDDFEVKAHDDNIIMVFSLKDASGGLSSEREDSPSKFNGRQGSIESNASISSASYSTNSEPTDSRHSPNSPADKQPCKNSTEEPVLVKLTGDEIEEDAASKTLPPTKEVEMKSTVSGDLNHDGDIEMKESCPVVSEKTTNSNNSDSLQRMLVNDFISGGNSETVISNTTTATTTSSPASSPALTSSSTTHTTTVTSSHCVVTTSTVPTLVSDSPMTDVSSGAPLDLCLKKSDNSVNSISSCRVKANLPVQMVLPQPQPQTGTSTAVTTVTSHTPMDVTYTTWSSKDQSKKADIQNGFEKLEAPTSDPSVPAITKDLKDDGPCFVQSKSLDLSSKLSMSSLASSDCSAPLNLSDISRFSQDSAQDLTVRVGLAPAPRINNPSDLSVKSSSNTESPILPSSTPQNDSSNVALDMVATPVTKVEKRMTEAELEKEFQKHLVELRALDKIAERKAQEQMQISLLRKRKAEILRYYDAKRKKLSDDKTNSTTVVSSVQEKRNSLKPTVSTMSSQRSVSESPNTPVTQNQSSIPSPPNSSRLYNGTRSPPKSFQNVPLVLTSRKNEVDNYVDLSKSSTPPESTKDNSVVASIDKANVSGFPSQPTSPLALTVGSKSTQNVQSNATVSATSNLTKAHQKPPSEMPPFTSYTSSIPSVISPSITGPYAKRDTVLTEPFIRRRNSVQKDENVQKAHSQRPFQSPGSLIISNANNKSETVTNTSSDTTISSPSQLFSPSSSAPPAVSKQSKAPAPAPEITMVSSGNPSKLAVSGQNFPHHQLPPPPIYRSQYSSNEQSGLHNTPENCTVNGNDQPADRSRATNVSAKSNEAATDLIDLTRTNVVGIEKRLGDPHLSYSQSTVNDQIQTPASVSSPKEMKKTGVEARSPSEVQKRHKKTLNRTGSKEHSLEPVALVMHSGSLPPPANMPTPAHGSSDDHNKHHSRNNQMGKIPRFPPPEYTNIGPPLDSWQRPLVPFHPPVQIDKSMVPVKDNIPVSEGPVVSSQEDMHNKYREVPKSGAPMRQQQPEVMLMPPHSSGGKTVPNPHSPNNYYWSQPQGNPRNANVYIPPPQMGPQHREGQPHLQPPPPPPPPPQSSSQQQQQPQQQPPTLSPHSAVSYVPIHPKRQQHIYQQQQHQKQQQQYFIQLQHQQQQQQQQHQQQHPPDQMLQVPHGTSGSYNGQSRLPSPDERQPLSVYQMAYPPHGHKIRHPQPPPPPPQLSQLSQHHQQQQQQLPPPPPQQQQLPSPHHHHHQHHHPQQRQSKQQSAPPISQQSSAIHHSSQVPSGSGSYPKGIPGGVPQAMPPANQLGPPPPMSGDNPSGPIYMGPPVSGPPMPGAPMIRMMVSPKWLALDGSLRQAQSSLPVPGPHSHQQRPAHSQSPTHQHLSPKQQTQPPPPPSQQQQQQQPPPSQPPPSQPPPHSQHQQQQHRIPRHDDPPPLPPQRVGPGAPVSLHPSMATMMPTHQVPAQPPAYNGSPRGPQGPPPSAHGGPMSTSSSSSSSAGVSNSLCHLCGKIAVFLCSNCRCVWYCNEQCQSKHWSVHAAECKPASSDPHY